MQTVFVLEKPMVSALSRSLFRHCCRCDMLNVDGDADAAVETRIRTGWNKFRQLVPLLANKNISLIVRGRLYSSYVQSSMMHGSETWPVKKRK